MTVKEFFENTERLAIHCNTEGKAIALLKAFDAEGYKWCNGEKYRIYDTYWDYYKEETCYSNKWEFCRREFYENDDYKIVEFEDIEELKDSKFKPDLSQFTTEELLKEIKRRNKENKQ